MKFHDVNHCETTEVSFVFVPEDCKIHSIKDITYLSLLLL